MRLVTTDSTGKTTVARCLSEFIVTRDDGIVDVPSERMDYDFQDRTPQGSIGRPVYNLERRLARIDWYFDATG